MNFKDKVKSMKKTPVANATGSDAQVTDVKENTATPAIEEGSLNPLAKRETKNIVSGSHLESIDIDLIETMRRKLNALDDVRPEIFAR